VSTSLTDAELAERFRRAAAGDAEAAAGLDQAIEALFSAHHDQVYAVCRRLVNDSEQARELTQETFLVAYQRLAEFRGESRFLTWVYGIARNKCRNARSRRRELLVEDGVVDPSDATLGVLSGLRQAEREATLHRVANAILTPLEQEAVHLRYVEGLSQEHITEVLQLENATGGRGLLQRCRRKLSRGLRQELRAMGHGSSFFQKTI